MTNRILFLNFECFIWAIDDCQIKLCRVKPNRFRNPIMKNIGISFLDERYDSLVKESSESVLKSCQWAFNPIKAQWFSGIKSFKYNGLSKRRISGGFSFIPDVPVPIIRRESQFYKHFIEIIAWIHLKLFLARFSIFYRELNSNHLRKLHMLYKLWVSMQFVSKPKNHEKGYLSSCVIDLYSPFEYIFTERSHHYCPFYHRCCSRQRWCWY